MTYKLAFKESALKEWKKLNPTLQTQFKKVLQERLKAALFSRALPRILEILLSHK